MPCVVVGGERIGLAARAVEREHLLAAQPLAQRMLANERVELAGDLGVPAAGEVGVDPLAQAVEPEIVEPRDLGLREALVGDVRERRPAPQVDCPPQRVRRVPRLAARELLAPERKTLLELLGVERADAQRVAAALVDHQALAQGAPQPRREQLHRVAGVPGPVSLPQLVDDAVDGGRGAAADEQEAQERERPPARHARAPAVREVDLDRAEDPELRVHLETRAYPG